MTTTTPTRPRRTLRDALAERDPEILDSCGRIAASIRENLERLSTLEPGHADLEGEDPAAIREALERSYAAPAAADRPEPAPDHLVWQRHWRRQLPRLKGLPLLAVGAGDDRKAPANLRNGELLKGWERTTHTPQQIESAHQRICSAGTRTGRDAGGLLAIDIDGATALSWLLERGCDPTKAQTWQVHRNTDPDRLKVCWRLTAEQQTLLGQLKTKVPTRDAVKDGHGKVIEKGEAVEVFHGTGQVVVLGHHPSSKGFYFWPKGQGPESLALIPPSWWEAVLQITDPPAKGSSARGATASSRTASKGDWRRLESCPICGRNERQFCSIHSDGKTIRCFHGSTFGPVQSHGSLKPGNEITDLQGTVWAFSREQSSGGEIFSIFVAPDPERRRQRPQQAHAVRPQQQAGGHGQLPPAPEPSPAVALSRKTRVGSDEVLAMLPYHLGELRLNVRSGEVHSSARGVISANAISRLYLELSKPFEVWPKEGTADGITLLASRNTFDPVAEYLEALDVEPLPMEQWQRLDKHLLGIDDPIAAAFLPRYFISAVARVFQPACYVRQVPVLIGSQERGKGELGRILFGAEHWVEGIGALDRDALMKCHTAWGVELAELDGVTRRADQEHLKAFLTETADVYRKPYDRSPERHERRFVFWGTSNRPPLRDSTGSTRFVCIPIPDRPLPLEWARHHRDALWARALRQYRSGVTWLRTSEAERLMVEERNKDFTELDPWADRVAAFLAKRALPGEVLPVKVGEVLGHLEVPTERQNTASAKRVREIAEGLGWRHGRRRFKGGDPTQGLWPPDETVHPTVHPVHPVCTPPCTPADPSQGERSDAAVHPVHPCSPKLKKERGGEQGGNVRKVLGSEGCTPCTPGQTDCSRKDLSESGGVHRGVHAPLWHAVALQLRCESPGVHPFTVALALDQHGHPGVSGREVAQLFAANPVAVEP